MSHRFQRSLCIGHLIAVLVLVFRLLFLLVFPIFLKIILISVVQKHDVIEEHPAKFLWTDVKFKSEDKLQVNILTVGDPEGRKESGFRLER